MKSSYKIISFIICCVFFLSIFIGGNFVYAARQVDDYVGTTNAGSVNSAETVNTPANPTSNSDQSNPKVLKEEDLAWYERGLRSAITWAVSVIAYVILVLLSFFLKAAGWLMRLSFDYSVVHMSNNINSMTTVGVAWKMLRDFANIAFIFFLLYVAIMTIIQSDKVNAKRTVVQIVIAALLINFSMFITKAAIDFSNVITLAFYNQILAIMNTKYFDEGLMQVLGLQSIYANPLSSAGDSVSTIQSWITGGWPTFLGMVVGSIIVIFISLFSFAAIAWLMLYRYIVVVFLIVLSPLAFAAQALPQLKELSGKWWKALIGQVTFPIMYMLLMLVSLTIFIGSISKGFNAQRGLQFAFNSISSTGKDPSSMSAVLNFGIFIVLINMSLILASQYASSAGGTASKVMNWGLGKVTGLQSNIQRKARAAATGTVGYVAREGVPGIRRIPYAGIPFRGIGENARILDKKLSNISSDTLAGKLIGNSRVGRWVRGGTVTAMSTSKFGTSMSAKDAKKLNDEVKAKDNEIKITKEFEAAHSVIGEYNKLKDAAEKSGVADPRLSDETYMASIRKARDTVSAFVNEKASNDQIEKLDNKKLLTPEVLQHLDSGQWKKIMEGTEKSDKDKEELRKARRDILKKATAYEKKDGVEIKTISPENKKMGRNIIKNTSGGELVKMIDTDPELLNNDEFIKLITADKLRQMENLDDESRIKIGTKIVAMSTGGYVHPAEGFITSKERASTWGVKAREKKGKKQRDNTPAPATTPEQTRQDVEQNW